MKKVKFKLQNLVLTEKYGMDDNWWMIYRTSTGRRMKYDNINSCFSAEKNISIDCFTYFNSITVWKWKKYTKVNDITLNLKIKGDFDIYLFGHYRETGEIHKEWIKKQRFYCPKVTEVSITFPDTIKSQVCAFHIETLSEVEIYGGYYSTFIDEDKLSDISISIATTTFQKEEYIDSNIRLLERDLFYSDEPAGRHIRMQVIDNGRTLDADKYNNKYVHVYPNQNVGGAGGFTRGMLESLKLDPKPTHILLMDDDVRILPESLIRTWSLLTLLKEEYDSHFISGAMLYMEHMNIQHEDVGYVHKEDGSFGPRKPGFELHLWDHVFMNEEDYAPMPDSYAGWWYCCIPVKTIDMNDLPIPLFIRGDDVEYSIKQQAQFITLGGICIWHKGFVNKYTASLELYQVHRNSLIIQAMSGICHDVDFMDRIDEFFWKEIKRLSYQSCELLLDAVEDYLNGPEFMMTPQGERIMKEHGAKNEKMKDIRDFRELETDKKLKLDKPLADACDRVYEEAELTGFKKVRYNVTRNGHIGPNWMLKKEIGIIPYDWFEAPGRQYMKTELLAVNPVERTAYLRVRSRKRYLELTKRRKRLFKIYKRQGKKIAAQYREAAKTLKGQQFWENYLGM